MHMGTQRNIVMKLTGANAASREIKTSLLDCTWAPKGNMSAKLTDVRHASR